MPLEISFILDDEDLQDLGYTSEMIDAISDADRTSVEEIVVETVDIDVTSVLGRALQMIGASKEDLTEDVVRARIFAEKTKNDPRMF